MYLLVICWLRVMHRLTGITHRRQFVRSAEGTVPSLSPDVAKRLENQLQANFGFWKEAPRERWLGRAIACAKCGTVWAPAAWYWIDLQTATFASPGRHRWVPNSQPGHGACMPQDAMHTTVTFSFGTCWICWNILQVFRKDQLLPVLCQLQSLKKLGKPTVAKRKLKVLANSASAFHRGHAQQSRVHRSCRA